jgi:hypothetical protein
METEVWFVSGYNHQTGKSAVPYDPEEHQIYKFIYFRSQEKELLLLGSGSLEYHPVGAGICEKGNVIVGWRSIGFRVKTRIALRPRILELITGE